MGFVRDIECIYVLMDVVGSRLSGFDDIQVMFGGILSACEDANASFGDRMLIPAGIVLGDSAVAVLAPGDEAGVAEFASLVRRHLPGRRFHVGAARGTLWSVNDDVQSSGGPVAWETEEAAGKGQRHLYKVRGWRERYPVGTLLSEP